MGVSSDSLDSVSLSATPNSSQLFLYENLSLSCGKASWSRGWKVMRAIGEPGNLSVQVCGHGWGISSELGCLLTTVQQYDTGIYWCQSTRSRRSGAVHIIVNSEAAGRSRTHSL